MHKALLVALSLAVISPASSGATHRGYISEDLHGQIYAYDWSIPALIDFAPRPSGMGVIGGTALSADSRTLFVSSSGRIWMLDTETLGYSPQALNVPARYMVAGPTGRFLYAGTSDSLVIIDLTGALPNQTIPLPGGTFRVAVTPDNSNVVVITGAVFAAVVKIGSPHTLRGVVPLGGQPGDVVVSPDSKRAILPLRSAGIAVINLATLARTVWSPPPGCEPNSASFSPAGTRLYLACGSTNGYAVLHGVTGAPIASGKLPSFVAGPRTVTATPDGKQVWFPTEPEGHIFILNAATLEPLVAPPGIISGAEHCDTKVVFGNPSYDAIDSQSGLASYTSAREAAPAACAPGQVLRVTARWRNNSTKAWSDLFGEVLALTGGNTLIEQNWDLTADGIVNPGEVFTGVFRIRLNTCASFTFQVSLAGTAEPVGTAVRRFSFTMPAERAPHALEPGQQEAAGAMADDPSPWHLDPH